MVTKKELEFEIRRMQRRIGFRSESRVEENILFNVIFAMLIEINNWNEEKLVKELEKGNIKFRHYHRISGNIDTIKKIDITIDISKGTKFEETEKKDGF